MTEKIRKIRMGPAIRPRPPINCEALRAARVDADLSLWDLVARLRDEAGFAVSHSALQRYERGIAPPPRELVEALEQVLRVRLAVRP
jgi:hypothetical protein